MNDLIGANWIFLSPIFILSVLGLAVIIERTVYFRRIRLRSPGGVDERLKRIHTGSRSVMEGLHPRDVSPAKLLLESAVSSRLKSVPQLYKQSLEVLRDRCIERMERNLGVLPGIANAATLLGLFGTVSGMITAFSRMTQAGSSDPYILAGGISRALVTTAAGLAVAIPVLLAHSLFENLSDRHAERMEEVLTECVSRSGAMYARKREAKA